MHEKEGILLFDLSQRESELVEILLAKRARKLFSGENRKVKRNEAMSSRNFIKLSVIFLAKEGKLSLITEKKLH